MNGSAKIVLNISSFGLIFTDLGNPHLQTSCTCCQTIHELEKHCMKLIHVQGQTYTKDPFNTRQLISTKFITLSRAILMFFFSVGIVPACSYIFNSTATKHQTR